MAALQLFPAVDIHLCCARGDVEHGDIDEEFACSWIGGTGYIAAVVEGRNTNGQ